MDRTAERYSLARRTRSVWGAWLSCVRGLFHPRYFANILRTSENKKKQKQKNKKQWDMQACSRGDFVSALWL